MDWLPDLLLAFLVAAVPAIGFAFLTFRALWSHESTDEKRSRDDKPR